jgi:hypothetical protein
MLEISRLEISVPTTCATPSLRGATAQGKMEHTQEVQGNAMMRRIFMILLVSQEFHNQRAIFIARHEGLDAIGFNAPTVGVYYSFATHCREQAAKVAAVLDVYLFRRRAKFPGPRVPIGPIPQKEPV